MKNKSFHQSFLAEIDKMMIIADKQLEENIISTKEYRKIMFLLIDKTEDYIQNLEKFNAPRIEVENFKNIDLFQLTRIIFCTG